MPDRPACETNGRTGPGSQGVTGSGLAAEWSAEAGAKRQRAQLDTVLVARPSRRRVLATSRCECVLWAGFRRRDAARTRRRGRPRYGLCSLQGNNLAFKRKGVVGRLGLLVTGFHPEPGAGARAIAGDDHTADPAESGGGFGQLHRLDVVTEHLGRGFDGVRLLPWCTRDAPSMV